MYFIVIERKKKNFTKKTNKHEIAYSAARNLKSTCLRNLNLD